MEWRRAVELSDGMVQRANEPECYGKESQVGAGGRLRSQRDTRSQNKSKILVYGVAGNFRGADNGCGGRVGDVVRRFPGWKKSRKQKQKK